MKFFTTISHTSALSKSLLSACFAFSLLLPQPTRGDITTASENTAFFKGLQYQHQESVEGRERANLVRFFDSRHCPLTQYANDFLTAAERYNIDYALLPAISVIESQCGKVYPVATRNPFGWASARTGFDSIPSAIDFISGQLANGHYYSGKTITAKLHAYCPNPTYPARVEQLMQQIHEKDFSQQ